MRWGVAQDGWASSSGRETLGRARCAHSGRGHCLPPQTRLQHARDSGPKRKGKGGGERVLQQHNRAAVQTRAQPNALLASGASHPAAPSRAIRTCAAAKGVRPLCPFKVVCEARASLRARQLTRRSTGGGSRSTGPAQLEPRHVPLPSHALSTLVKKNRYTCHVAQGGAHPCSRPLADSSVTSVG